MQINIYQILFQALNFGVILLVLNKVLYKPILKLLDERAQKINEGMALAEKNQKASAEIDKLKSAELSKARREAAAIIRKAEADAKKQALEIIDKAKKDAHLEADRITRNATRELEAAKKALLDQSVDLANAMINKALTEHLSTADAGKITKSIIAKLN